MIKKKNEDSKLIDFKNSSDSPRLQEMIDVLIKEFNIGQKHLPRKKLIYATLITNLYDNQKRGFSTAIPRGEKFYSNRIERYKTENISHDLIVEFLDKLIVNEKYAVEKYKAPKNEYGESSIYVPTDYLMSLCDVAIADNITVLEDECILLRKRVSKDTIIRNGELIRVTTNQSSEISAEESITSGIEDEGQLTKNYKKILIPYDDNEYTNRIRSDLNEYNRFRVQNSIALKNLPAKMLFSEKYCDNIRKFASTDISKIKPNSDNTFTVPLRPDHLVRIFTENFDLGGRFYRGFETQLKKELRPYIAINGNPTVEYDYSSYHIRLLHHIYNKRCPDDPYMVFPELDEEEGRDYYKTMVAACLNNCSEKSVLRTMRHYIIKKGIIDCFTDITDKGLKTGLDMLKKHNRKVSRYFFQGDGLKYHRIDSDIANNILMHFTRLKNPLLVLCVHDSFITESDYGKELLWTMNKFYREKVHKLPKIK